MARAKAPKRTKEREQELEDLRQVLTTPAGFRFVKRLINITGPYRSTYSSNDRDHAFLEGGRNFGCRLVADMVEACPEQYVRLLVESNLTQEIKESTNVIHKVEQDD